MVNIFEGVQNTLKEKDTQKSLIIKIEISTLILKTSFFRDKDIKHQDNYSYFQGPKLGEIIC